MNFLKKTGSALLVLTLTGCGTSSSNFPLPPIPVDIRKCFDELTPTPVNTPELTQVVIFELIAALRESEVSKSLCGKRLVFWYESHMKI